jgi:hypothetical protein
MGPGLSKLSELSELLYLHYLCLAPWIPSLLAVWLPGSLAVLGSIAPWLLGCQGFNSGSLAPRRPGP